MADEVEELEQAAPAPSLVERIRATRAARHDDDAVRRSAWLLERAAEEAAQLERSEAAKRIRAASYAGRAADPADVVLALGSSDALVDKQ